MSAAAAVRAALVARLKGAAALAGIEINEGGGACLPRIEIAEAQAVDWSAKGLRGREMRTAVVVRAAGGQRGRVAGLVEAVEREGEALTGEIGGWRVAGAVFVRSRAAEEEAGVRAVLVEHRVRVVET